MEEIKKFKNIVIGAGPAGRLGSFELGKLGEETLLIEKKYGYTIVNYAQKVF